VTASDPPGWWTRGRWSAFTAWHALAEHTLPYRPLDEIHALQRHRIRAIVRHAYETVPYYRDVMKAAGQHPADFNSAEDLRKLPLLSADQVAREPGRFLSSQYANGGSLALRSSGTAGRLRVIHYDPRALFLALAHGHRQRVVFRRFVGRASGYREMNVGRPGSIAESIRGFYESSAWVPRFVELSREAMSPSLPFEEAVARINAFKPDILMGYGSFLGALVRRARRDGVSVARPSLVVYGGDAMADDDRALIEEDWSVPVVSVYQAAEALHLAFQCELRRAFHVNHDHVTLDVIDERGVKVGPGETGIAVISNLTNYATVILNYCLGDLVTVGREPCPCGRTLPTIDRIEGRADDYVTLPEGRRLHALTVQSVLHRVDGVIQVQIVQETLDRFLLKVVYTGSDEWTAVGRRIVDTMGQIVGPCATVHVEQVNQLAVGPNLKVKAVISNVDERGGSCTPARA
jgi:phenylacetate-CoA ligase